MYSECSEEVSLLDPSETPKRDNLLMNSMRPQALDSAKELKSARPAVFWTGPAARFTSHESLSATD